MQLGKVPKDHQPRPCTLVTYSERAACEKISSKLKEKKILGRLRSPVCEGLQPKAPDYFELNAPTQLVNAITG